MKGMVRRERFCLLGNYQFLTLCDSGRTVGQGVLPPLKSDDSMSQAGQAENVSFREQRLDRSGHLTSGTIFGD